jgi:hypothetical protein
LESDFAYHTPLALDPVVVSDSPHLPYLLKLFSMSLVELTRIPYWVLYEQPGRLWMTTRGQS